MFSALRVALLLFCVTFTLTAAAQETSWTFAVSGDSRNCGDIVMPAIAASVHNASVRDSKKEATFRAPPAS